MRRSAVLLCGQARATVAAIAHALARTGAPLVIQTTPAEREATERLCRGLENRTSEARIVGGASDSEAASRALVTAAWKAARGLNAVVICPAIPASADRAEPDLAGWNDGTAAGLRAPFFLAKHAGLRLARAGGGRVVFAIGALPRGASPVSTVVQDGLQCLVAALAKALPTHVMVAAAISTAPGRDRRADIEIARAVRFCVEAEHTSRVTLLELGGPVHRG